MTSLPVSLSFESTELTIIDHQGKPWLSAADLARALGYSKVRSVANIYNRNADEFTHGMSEVIKLVTSAEINNLQTDTRIFSPRGCHLIAMFAKTKNAKTFRKWVLDVLDGLAFHEEPQIETITDAQMQELRRKVWGISHQLLFRESIQWNAWKRLRETFGVSPISKLPAARFDDAMAILTRWRGNPTRSGKSSTR